MAAVKPKKALRKTSYLHSIRPGIRTAPLPWFRFLDGRRSSSRVYVGRRGPPVFSILLGVIWSLGGLKQCPQDVHGAKAEAKDEYDSKCDGYKTNEGERHNIGCVRRGFSYRLRGAAFVRGMCLSGESRKRLFSHGVLLLILQATVNVRVSDGAGGPLVGRAGLQGANLGGDELLPCLRQGLLPLVEHK